MNPVIVTAHLEPADGNKEALLEALGEFIPRVHEEQGCELYAIHEAPDGGLVMIEKWTTLADLEAHGAGAVMAEINVAFQGKLAGPPRVVTLVPLPFGGTRGAL
jgi:quinol monooxygenase YgiN